MSFVKALCRPTRAGRIEAPAIFDLAQSIRQDFCGGVFLDLANYFIDIRQASPSDRLR